MESDFKMKFNFCYNNFNVINLEKSLDFYKKVLGFKEVKCKEVEDGSFILVYLGDGIISYILELIWFRDWDRLYNLGDNEFYLVLEVEEFDEVKKFYKDLDCICFENESMGIYFIVDLDNYWIEIFFKNY